VSLDEALAEVSDEAARAAAKQFRARAIENLRQAGSRLDYDVEPIAQSATPVTQSGDSYSFTFTHPASAVMEFGSEPHTITPNDDEVLTFQQGGETVYATEVEHPGTTALLFVSKAQQELDTSGLREQFVRE
jgi:hypothetical protein